MLLQFLCPNGHRIHCDAKRAGLAAKCPKCGEKFRIPTLAELESAEATEGEVPAPQAGVDPSLAAAAGESAVSPGPATSADQIEFLCPNNHLVYAPVGLQGEPSQCPQCGSRFRVPFYEESPGDDGQPESMSVDALGGSSLAMDGPPPPEESQTGAAPAGHEGVAPALPLDEAAAAVAPTTSGPTTGADPVFRLFCRLWSQRTEGASVEIRYGEGQRLTPDRFAKTLSSGSCAVFAVDEPNGTYVVTTIPWASITAIVVRGLKSLPEGMET
jgi:hypothetical protein